MSRLMLILASPAATETDNSFQGRFRPDYKQVFISAVDVRLFDESWPVDCGCFRSSLPCGRVGGRCMAVGILCWLAELWLLERHGAPLGQWRGFPAHLMRWCLTSACCAWLGQV